MVDIDDGTAADGHQCHCLVGEIHQDAIARVNFALRLVVAFQRDLGVEQLLLNFHDRALIFARQQKLVFIGHFMQRIANWHGLVWAQFVDQFQPCGGATGAIGGAVGQRL